MASTEFVNNLTKLFGGLSDFLQYKNTKYGNSALKPLHIFNKGSEGAIEQRLDDKLSRIQNNPKLQKNDVVDLLGYLCLLCVRENWYDFKEFCD